MQKNIIFFSIKFEKITPYKTYIFLADKGIAPPPLADMSASNVIFFGRLPLSGPSVN